MEENSLDILCGIFVILKMYISEIYITAINIMWMQKYFLTLNCTIFFLLMPQCNRTLIFKQEFNVYKLDKICIGASHEPFEFCTGERKFTWAFQ